MTSKGDKTEKWGKERGERLGKKLCYLLRYGAEKENVTVHPGDYVLVRELLTVSLLENHTEEEVMRELNTSVSMRQCRRFQVKTSNEGEPMARATYGRRMERSEFHEGSKVRRLLNLCLRTAASNIALYGFEDFHDNYTLNLLMRQMKRDRTLSSKTLRTFFVSGLTHLDLWDVYVTEASLKSAARNCPNLKCIILRDCGYLVTDHLLHTILKGWKQLESLNLCGCHHVSDNGLRSIVKNCPKLRHINLTFLSKITPTGILEIVQGLSKLEEVNMYDYAKMTGEVLNALHQITNCRNFRIEIAGVTTTIGESPYDSKWERPNYR